MAPEDDKPEGMEAGYWIDLLEGAERYFQRWQARADWLDRIYSDLEYTYSVVREPEFAIFWSNIQIMLPSIYARPPLPVVTPKFKDRRPLYRTASEFLERNCVVSLDMDNINGTMMAIRDDLAIIGRGVGWVRYKDDEGKDPCVHYEHVDRRDFAHDPARCWRDVSWVARRGWLTYDEMVKRFGKKAADTAPYEARRSDHQDNLDTLMDHTRKCGVWELWHKPSGEVVWFVPGMENVLDKKPAHLKLEGFFPCPEPVYSTTQRRTLIPLPDAEKYADQLREINLLTQRIHVLGQQLQMKGFYQAGGDIGDAVETALNVNDTSILVPVRSTAGMVQGADPIIWMPIQQVAETIQACVLLRRQLIDDVYQIVGLSDIMRGATEAEETFVCAKSRTHWFALRATSCVLARKSWPNTLMRIT
jgi:hypothetical protein